MKQFRVVIERLRDRVALAEIREVADVADLMKTFRVMLREAAESGACSGFSVTVHVVGEGCDHEL